ncbi:MAG: hypothetical protein HY273_16190 [Gammaproteobacteria bacterium]|nr:hypothetical protein [Gammaproteobacteria bacterium]
MISLIVLGSAMALSQGRAVWFATSLVLAMYVATSTTHLAPALKMLRRMRWLFISIVGFYFWFTPGEPLWGGASNWLPSVEGLQLGGARIAALVTLVLAVNLLLQTTSRDAMVSAVLWLTKPLHWLGFAHERLAVRLSLVFEAVREVQSLYAAMPTSTERRTPLARFGERVATLFEQTLQRADTQELHELHVDISENPPWYQWLYPLLTAIALLAVLASERLG